MPHEKIEFLSAVLLVSKDPERLARFYREALHVPLEEERHGDTLPHWGCTLGDVHFAIHPLEDFPDRAAGVGSVKLAFTVFDLDGFVRALAHHGVEVLHAPKDEGFGRVTAVRDPDGNFLEFTQLSDAWLRHLEERRGKGFDVLTRWKASKGSTGR